jgi:FixJ family two-component response regulator
LNVQPFSSARDFLKSPRPEDPACLVLDVRMPGLSGIDLQRELTQSGFHIPIIFITGHGDIPMSVRAMKAGAAEFLTKPFRSRVLLDAIRAAIERDRSALQKQSETRELRERYEQLTPREREVMTLVAKGLLNKQVAGKSDDRTTLEEVEREHIIRALAATNWVVGGPKGAGARLGLARTTLIAKMQKLGISRAQA